MIDLKLYGYDSIFEYRFNEEINRSHLTQKILEKQLEFIPGRITAVHKERYDVICSYGEIHGRLKSSVYFDDTDEDYPTVGDFVVLQYNDLGDSIIHKTLERKSKFSRNDFQGHAKGYVKHIKEQVVAGNFNHVFIITSLNMDLNLQRIERYLTQAWESGGSPAIILTKSDLVSDCSDYISQVESIAFGVPIFALSSYTGDGLDALTNYLKPEETIVFLGSSGVGKSSLVNALAKEDIMAVNTIREDDSKGRHTTTHRQLIRLKSGVMIIDTPGMRELGMWQVDGGLSNAFSDVEVYFEDCRFNDCSHKSEPGCGVKAAIESGDLSEERWESYLKIQKENKFVENKAAYLKSKDAFFKDVSKKVRHIKKTKH